MAAMTSSELFEKVCRAIAPGNAWPAAIADLLGVRLDTVRHWRSGRSHLRPDHFESLLAVLVDRQDQLRAAEVELRAWLAKQPRED